MDKPIRFWTNTFAKLGLKLRKKPGKMRQLKHRSMRMEQLQDRRMLATDLIVSSFGADGQDWTVTYDVTDQAAAAFDIGIYRSSDGVTADTLIQTERITDSADLTVGSGHSVTVVPNFTDVEEDHYLIAKLDDADENSESSEIDNRAVFAGGRFVNRGDDTLQGDVGNATLEGFGDPKILDGVDIELLSFSGDGEDMIIYYSVHNADASPFDISVYRSLDGVKPIGKPVAVIAAPELAEGRTYKAVIPAPFGYMNNADFTLIAKVDATDAVPESDETDNVMAYEGGLLGSSLVDWSSAATANVRGTTTSDVVDVATTYVSGTAISDIEGIVMMSLPSSATTITGGSGDDTYTVSIDANNNIVVNGTTYSPWVKIYAAGGSNTVSLTGKAGEEVGEFTPRVSAYSSSTPFLTGEWLGPNDNYKIEIYDTNTIYAYGQTTEDSVTITGTSGDDTVVSKPYADWSYLLGSGYYMRAKYIEEVVITAGSGGTDTASMRDGTGDDTFHFNETNAGEGRMDAAPYNVTCMNFPAIDVIHQSTGADTAYLHDSSADETFTVSADRDANGTNIVHGTFVGNGRTVTLSQFRSLYAYGTRGGSDTAYMYDSPSDDTFTNRPNDYDGLGYANLVNTTGTNDYYFGAKGFEAVFAYASNGGSDYASMQDKSGNDLAVSELYTGTDRMTVSGTGHYARAAYFEDVDVNLNQGGYDKTYAYTPAGTTPTVGDDTVQVVIADRDHQVINTPYIEVTTSGNGTTGPMELGQFSNLVRDEDFTIEDIAVTGLSTATLSAASDNTSLVSASGVGSNVRLAPVANQYGATTIRVEAYDSTYQTTAYTNFDLSINSVDDPPTSANNTVTATEDTTYVFSVASFPFADIEGASLSKVKITQLESAGSLKLNGTPVVLNQEITASQLSSGSLTFEPAANANGAPYTNFRFKVSDGSLYSILSYTMTVNVNAVFDPPILDPIGNKSVDEQTELTFTATATDQDLPADTLTFSLDAAAIALGMSITTGGDFSWTPTEAQGGSDYSATITVTDSGTGTLTDSETISITVGEVNVAPILDPIGNKLVDEQAELAFTATATDQDLPADSLTFTLDAAAIALGMSITTGGQFSWTPTESQGGSDYSATITVTDSGTGTLTDSETITITVGEVNVAPILDPIGNKLVDEQAELTFTATATDQDLPADTLTFSLDAAAISLGMSITAGGQFSWTPTESQGGSTYDATITVTDSGTGNLIDSETISITVGEVNVAPILDPIGNKLVDEQAELAFTATATDQDLPADTLTFTLDAAAIALGMSITTGGQFSWTPTESQGGNSYDATITVTDSGTGTLTDSETITITVGEVNVAPILDPIGNKLVDEQAELAFTATATDQDLPADTLTFSLDPAAISLGMSITAGGQFSWTPTESQGGSAYDATITVTDSGTGNLIDSETITITVGEVNVAPVLAEIGNQSINEQTELAFTATASDQDLPADTLTFSLDAAAIALACRLQPAVTSPGRPPNPKAVAPTTPPSPSPTTAPSSTPRRLRSPSRKSTSHPSWQRSAINRSMSRQSSLSPPRPAIRIFRPTRSPSAWTRPPSPWVCRSQPVARSPGRRPNPKAAVPTTPPSP